MKELIIEFFKKYATSLWHWLVAVGVLFVSITSSILVYMGKEILDKIEYSYDANKNQEHTNRAIIKEIEALKRMDSDIMDKDEKLDSENDKLSERLYMVEAIVKYTRPNTIHQN